MAEQPALADQALDQVIQDDTSSRSPLSVKIR
jgi:hypothetical protein